MIEDIEFEMNEKHFPPVVGEFAYYDARLNFHESHVIDLNRWEHCLVVCCENEGKLGCNYSMPYRDIKRDYITCHGKIKEIYKHNLPTELIRDALPVKTTVKTGCYKRRRFC
jgi:hypothetical protein